MTIPYEIREVLGIKEGGLY
nr:hypothetical protein [Sulfolobus sp. E5-1-F]